MMNLHLVRIKTMAEPTGLFRHHKGGNESHTIFHCKNQALSFLDFLFFRGRLFCFFFFGFLQLHTESGIGL